MNIIEPCCAERQLGHLLRENRGNAVLFQTNGDMTLQKWMKATMLMAGDRPRTLTLAVPIFTGKMLDAVVKFMRLGWVERLRLLTTDPLIPEMAHALAVKADCEAAALAGRVELAADANIPDGLLMFTGPEGTVVIQGEMPDTITPRLHLYAGVFGRTEGRGVRSISDAWEARFRARRYEWPTGGDAIAAYETESDDEPLISEEAADPAPSETKKKSRTRKTKKSDEKPLQ